jgi:hypothetical protein
MAILTTGCVLCLSTLLPGKFQASTRNITTLHFTIYHPHILLNTYVATTVDVVAPSDLLCKVYAALWDGEASVHTSLLGNAEAFSHPSRWFWRILKAEE